MRRAGNVPQSVLQYARCARTATVPVSAGLLTDPGAYFDSLTAYREGKGILTKVSGNCRNRKWAAPEILDGRDELAARAERRSRSS